MKFTTLRIDQFADVYSGGTPSTLNMALWDGGIPWITPKDLAGYEARYVSSGERDISEEGLANSSAKLLPADTVLLSTRAPVGYVAIAAVPLATNQGFKNLVCKPGVAIPGFVYYLLKHNTEVLESHATGATFKELSGSRLKAIAFELPDTDLQIRIADILSAYDDLIENNRRRMALLEEGARQLYREWFVHLRFPGYEHTRITNGVPEGWERMQIRDFGIVVTGKTPSTKETDNYSGEVPFIKTPDMHGEIYVTNTQSRLTEKGADTQKGKYVPPDSVLVSCIGTVGVVALTSTRSQFNQQINAVIPFEEYCRYYCFFAFQDLKQRMEAIGGGVTMDNVSKSKFEGLEVMRPATRLLRDFDETCAPMFRQVLILSLQIGKLRAARDLLLPRLLSGAIAV